MDSAWGSFFRICDRMCLKSSSFTILCCAALSLLWRKIRVALSLFPKEVRLGADRYLRTTCWPSFGTPRTSYSGRGPLRPLTRLAGFLHWVAAILPFWCPRILSTQGFQLLPTGSLLFLWSLEARFPEEAMIQNRYTYHYISAILRGLKYPGLGSPKLEQRFSVMMGRHGGLGHISHGLLSLGTSSHPVLFSPSYTPHIMRAMSHHHMYTESTKEWLTFKSPQSILPPPFHFPCAFEYFLCAGQKLSSVAISIPHLKYFSKDSVG